MEDSTKKMLMAAGVGVGATAAIATAMYFLGGREAPHVPSLGEVTGLAKRETWFGATSLLDLTPREALTRWREDLDSRRKDLDNARRFLDQQLVEGVMFSPTYRAASAKWTKDSKAWSAESREWYEASKIEREDRA